MTDLHRIVIDGLDYQIALPDHRTDYIQGKIAQDAVPYELSMLRAMTGRLTPGDLVLDIGANIGNHTLYLAAFGCHVHAFEPNRSLCEAMHKSAIANGFDNLLQIHSVGVGAKPAKAHFHHLDEKNLGAQSLAIGSSSVDDITVVRLDDLRFEQKVSAIKIDVEGMELSVLIGAAQLIERDIPALYIECQSEEAFQEVQSWVSARGYLYWDTFNATPTHLFLNEKAITESQRHERTVAHKVRETYSESRRYDKLKSTLDDANAKYRVAGEQIVTLKLKLEQTNDKYRALSQAHSKLKEELEAERQKSRDSSQALAHSQHHAERLEEEIRVAEKELALSREALEKARAESESKATYSSAKEDELRLLKAELTRHASQLQETNANYLDAGVQIAALKLKLEQKNDKYLSLSKAHTALKAELEEVCQKYRASAQALTHAQQRAEHIQDEIRAAEKEQTLSREALQFIRAEFESKTSLLSAKEDELRHLKAELARNATQLQETNANYLDAGVQIAALKLKLEQKDDKYLSVSEANTVLKAELEEARHKHRESSQALTHSRQRAEQLQDEIRGAEKEHMRTREALQLTRAELESMAASLSAKEDELRLLRVGLEQHATQLQETKAKYREAAEQIAVLEQRLDQTEKALQGRSEALDIANQKYRHISQANVDLKNAIQTVSAKYKDATSTLIPTLKSKLDAQVARSAELLERAEQLNAELAQAKSERVDALRALSALRASRTYMARKFLHQARCSLSDAIKLPVRLWRIRNRVSPPSVTSSAELDPILSRAPTAVAKAPPQILTGGPPAPSQLVIARSQPISLKLFRVACIMDDFTYGSYQAECELQQLTPDSWQDELESFQPELLFIESAWRGKDGLWGSKVGHTSQELQGIVSWCHKQCIPTVFWNKEDPVHFETFLNTARLFDYVFTTDIDCVHRYKAALEHDRVFFLPFACQPTVHNPIEKYERKDAFCFAGAYYVRYPERTRDLEDFVRELPAFRPFEIYDRNYGKDNPDYQFPETYQPYIVGTLPYDQIDKAYKGYRYAINLNSIKQSQTMFARRVYELLGSNTLVVSNYSRGVRLMFGDVVITSDSGSEIKRRLEVLEKENRTDRLRLAGLRKVMQEHTYGERIAYVLSKVTGREITQPLPSFKVLAAADTLEDVQRLVAHVQAQTGIDASLTLMLASGLSVAEVRAALPEPTFALELLYAEDVQGKKLAELADGACWVAGMVADDYYGPHYLLDIALATRYSDAHAIGKGAWYAWQQGQCALNDPDATYRPAPRLTARRSAITRALAEDIDATQWLTKLSEWTYEYSQQLAIDPYNYCADAIQGDPAEIRETVDDLPANHGISLQELIGIAETMPPMQHQEIDTPYFSGRELAHLLSGRPFVLHTNHEALSTEEQVDETIHLSRNQAIDAVLSGSTLQIRSELPDGKHEYLYSPVELDCNELLARLPESTDRKIPIHFEMEPGLNLSLVVLYLDADKNRIGHVIEQPNRNRSIDLPDDAAYLRFGLRIYAGGAARIKRLLLGHLDLEPQVVLGQSDVLLLTNHYPSYDDLYRNGFVHSRVRGYREHGVHVDVFRLRENQPIAWHEFQDIDVTTGSQEALRRLLASGRYRHVLVHFLDPAMWEVLKDFIDTIPVTVWVHGAEIHPWYRRKFNIHTPEQEQAAREQSEQRMAFWRGLLQTMPANLKLVFVSRTFSEEVMEDLGFRLPENQYAIIHNPIDTELFAYAPKSPEQRTKILSIRPYASKIYANDLSIEAIKLLSTKSFFNELEFMLIGDGALFDETVAPVKDFSNVTVEKRFLRQHEIAALHKEYGVFLCPSRMDTQGVSRDEAMSSGLVPITNVVASIPEFVDNSCGVLVPAESAEGLADGVICLYNDPNRFRRLSQSASERVRRQSDKKLVIKQELDISHSTEACTGFLEEIARPKQVIFERLDKNSPVRD